MKKNKISVVLADDNRAITDSICERICEQEDIEVVGTAENGLEAVEIIKEKMPDVVVLDVIMPHLDGFGVLERISEESLEKRPVFIVLSAVGQDCITQRALALGAEYFIVKPFDINVLVSRIRQMKDHYNPSMNQKEYSSLSEPAYANIIQESVATRVTRIMHEIGIPPHVKGYRYLRVGIEIVVENLEILNSVTTQLYPKVAERFDTTPSRVERAIRHAIEIAWSRTGSAIINDYFGYIVHIEKGKPTNSEIIAMIADKLRIES